MRLKARTKGMHPVPFLAVRWKKQYWIRRADWHVLPIYGAVYALALADRANISIARVVGMDQDLGLSIGSRFSIVVGVYFVPDVLCPLPSNLLLRRVGPRKLLSFCVISWGVVQLFMGFAPNWRVLAVCRALLGILEAGFTPALIFIISTWYTRQEVQTRLAIFYVVGFICAGFGSILSYTMSLLSGRMGIAGWAWIFIIHGAITIALGILASFLWPSFPHSNTFLSDADTTFILDRVERDRGDSLPDQLTWRKFVDAFDWCIAAYALMMMFATMSLYGATLFLAPVLYGFGWSATQSLLLVAPPFILGGISTLIFSLLSDHYRQRALFIAIQCCFTLTGWSLVGFAPSNSWRYVGTFLNNAGSSGSIIGLFAYSSNNIVSHSRRAIVSSVVLSAAGLGGLTASYIFYQASAPRYLPGILITLGSQLGLLLVLASTTLYFYRENIRASRDSAPLEGRSGFLYTL